MNIFILSTQKTADCWRVKFSSRFGEASANWLGSEPKGGDRKDVEIDGEKWELLDASIKERVPSVTDSADGNGAILVGAVEALTTNDIVVLRIGDDLLQCDCLSQHLSVGEWVRLRTQGLQLYEVNY